MPTTLPERGRKPNPARRQYAADGASEPVLLGASLLVAFTFAVTSALAPAALVLPFASVAILVCAVLLGCVGLIMRRKSQPQDQLVAVAGVLALFSFSVAIICDKSEALRLLLASPGL
jgi:Zn-dependent alcohol dehydrogenase